MRYFIFVFICKYIYRNLFTSMLMNIQRHSMSLKQKLLANKPLISQLLSSSQLDNSTSQLSQLSSKETRRNKKTNKIVAENQIYDYEDEDHYDNIEVNQKAEKGKGHSMNKNKSDEEVYQFVEENDEQEEPLQEPEYELQGQMEVIKNKILMKKANNKEAIQIQSEDEEQEVQEEETQEEVQEQQYLEGQQSQDDFQLKKKKSKNVGKKGQKTPAKGNQKNKNVTNKKDQKRKDNVSTHKNTRSLRSNSHKQGQVNGKNIGQRKQIIRNQQKDTKQVKNNSISSSKIKKQKADLKYQQNSHKKGEYSSTHKTITNRKNDDKMIDEKQTSSKIKSKIVAEKIQKIPPNFDGLTRCYFKFQMRQGRPIGRRMEPAEVQIKKKELRTKQVQTNISLKDKMVEEIPLKEVSFKVKVQVNKQKNEETMKKDAKDLNKSQIKKSSSKPQKSIKNNSINLQQQSQELTTKNIEERDDFFDEKRQFYDEEYRQQEQEQLENEPQENNKNQKINLGSLELVELVEVLKNEGMISSKMFDKFSSTQDIYSSMDFLHKFTSGQLQSYNFQKYPFTLLDHRRISELMSNLFSQKYQIGEIVSPNKDIHTFLYSLYDLEPKRYYELYKTIDKVSKINWWNQIIRQNEESIKKGFSMTASTNQSKNINKSQLKASTVKPVKNSKESLKISTVKQANPSKQSLIVSTVKPLFKGSTVQQTLRGSVANPSFKRSMVSRI